MVSASLLVLVIYAARKNMITERRAREKNRSLNELIKYLCIFFFSFFNVCSVTQDHFCCYAC